MDAACMKMQETENKLLSNVQLKDKPENRSWLEELEEYEKDMMESHSAPEEDDDNTMTSQSNMIESAVKIVAEPSPDTSCDRELVVQFLDTSNEEKYDRLIKEEKIKTPLKRRCSSSRSTSRSTSPYEGESSCGTSVNSDESNQRFCSKKSKVGDGKSKNREYETSEEVLARRQKQIEYGKNTIGYDIYTKQVPRQERTGDHPWTPPKNHKYSRRAFDGLVKVWRKKLHCYDKSGAIGSAK